MRGGRKAHHPPCQATSDPVVRSWCLPPAFDAFGPGARDLHMASLSRHPPPGLMRSAHGKKDSHTPPLFTQTLLHGTNEEPGLSALSPHFRRSAAGENLVSPSPSFSRGKRKQWPRREEKEARLLLPRHRRTLPPNAPLPTRHENHRLFTRPPRA